MQTPLPTDIQGRSQNLRHLYPDMGAKLGVFWFSHNQNNRSSSGAYVTCIYCGLSMKKNMCKMLHGAWRFWIYLFCMCGWQRDPSTSNLSPMADNAITQGGIQCLGSPLYICALARLFTCTVSSSICTASALHMLFFFNSRCKQARLFSDDQCIVSSLSGRKSLNWPSSL